MPPNGTTESIVGIDTSHLVEDGERRNAYTLAALGMTAAAALAAERYGISQDLPEPLESVANSLAHPMLGYAGAWMAESTVIAHVSHPLGRFRKTAVFVGATITNFATEILQSATIASPEYANFVSASNLPETTKDYAAALTGMGLYLWQNRRASPE